MIAGIGKIQYQPDAPANEVFCFRHYNPQEKVRGRSMEDWLRFSVCFWHTFRGTGEWKKKRNGLHVESNTIAVQVYI